MDQRQLTDLMNEDLGTEYRSIVQYTQHIATLKGLEVQSIVAELRQHVAQELNHAMILAEQIDFLGGVPTVEVPRVPSATDTQAALHLDLELEEQQLQRYRDRIEQAEELSLPDGRGAAATAGADPGARARLALGARSLAALTLSKGSRAAVEVTLG